MTSSERLKPHQSHVPALDGIRGLAIGLILIHHLLTANDQVGGRLYKALTELRGACWVGVDLFFALSGFLITGILYDSLAKKNYFRNFYARRTLRIFPLYYGFLALLFIFTGPLHLHWDGMQWFLLLYLQNMGWFHHSFVSFTPSASVSLNHFWSLAVEEQFYLVYPLLIYWIADRKRLIAVTFGLSLATLALRIFLRSHGVSQEFLYYPAYCRVDTLMLGGCLALLMRTPLRDRVIAASRPLFFAAALVLIGAAVHEGSFNWREGSFIPTFGFSLIALVAISLIAETFHPRSWSKAPLQSSILRFLGRYSYGIYVFHYSLDAWLTPSLRYFFLNRLHSKAGAVVFSAMVVASLSIVLAMISFRFYESRFLKLKKYFEARENAGPNAPTTPPAIAYNVRRQA